MAVAFKSGSAGPFWAPGWLLRAREVASLLRIRISDAAEPLLSSLHIYWASVCALIQGHVSTPKIKILVETPGHRIKCKLLSSVFNVSTAPAQKLANFSPQAKASQLLRIVFTFLNGYILNSYITTNIISSVWPPGL